MVLDTLLDETLMLALEAERMGRRDDYPLRAVWNSPLAGLDFQHPSIESLRRELRRNAELRQDPHSEPHSAERQHATYDDWVLLHQHTNIGADLLQGIDALKDTADVVRRHHCCWDGTGYPDGLEGDQVPLLARCLRILDVYCAMTSPRIYREGRATHKQALQHLRDEQGKHFDPELVEVFIKSRVGKT